METPCDICRNIAVPHKRFFSNSKIKQRDYSVIQSLTTMFPSEFTTDQRICICTPCQCHLRDMYDGFTALRNVTTGKKKSILRNLSANINSKTKKAEAAGGKFPRSFVIGKNVFGSLSTEVNVKRPSELKTGDGIVEENLCHNCNSYSDPLLVDFTAEIEGRTSIVPNNTAFYLTLMPGTVNDKETVGDPIKLCSQCSEALCGVYLFRVQFLKLTMETSHINRLIEAFLMQTSINCPESSEPDCQQLDDVEFNDVVSDFLEVKCEPDLEEMGFQDNSAIVTIGEDEEIEKNPATAALLECHQCFLCREDFSDQSELTKHMKLVHNVTILLSTSTPTPSAAANLAGNIPKPTTPNKLKQLKLTINKSKRSPLSTPRNICNWIAKTVVKPTQSTLVTGDSQQSEASINTDSNINQSASDRNDGAPSAAGGSSVCHTFKDMEKKLKRSQLAEVQFLCTKCPNRYRTKGGLRSHSIKHHQICTSTPIPRIKPKPSNCPTCGKIYHQPIRLKTHRYKSHQEKCFECVACPAKFGLFSEYKVHKKKFHAGKVNCKECGKQLSNLDSLAMHRRLACVKTSTTEICPHCRKSFKDLKGHIKNTHSLQAAEKPFICEICGSTFKHQCNLNIHIKTIHLVEEEFPCEICGRKFPHKRYLEKHLVVHSTEKKFECKVCKMKFKHQSNMHKHYIIQHGTEEEQGGPFECGVCGQVFRFRQHLSLHKRRQFHNGKEKNYSQAKKYKLERAQKVDLEHINVTEQEKILINGKVCYKCELCRNVNRAKFSSESFLKYHKAYRHWDILGLGGSTSVQSIADSNSSDEVNASSSARGVKKVSSTRILRNNK